MTFKRFCRACLAYLFATLTVLALAAVATEVVRVWVIVTFWQVACGLWLVSVGIPSVGWSTRQVSRALGIRPSPVVRLGGWRSIPVAGGVLADVGRSLFTSANGGQHTPALTVPDELTITCGNYVFPESEVLDVLQCGWRRQMQRRGAALARRYWLGRYPFMGDRDRYDAFCTSCEALGILVGRGDRASGRLAVPPLSSIYTLKFGQSGRAGITGH